MRIPPFIAVAGAGIGGLAAGAGIATPLIKVQQRKPDSLALTLGAVGVSLGFAGAFIGAATIVEHHPWVAAGLVTGTAASVVGFNVACGIADMRAPHVGGIPL